jgi:hypothetical protein
VDEVKNIEKQRAITSNMIEVAFRMLVDAERHSSLSADSLEREFTTVPRPLQLEVG